MDNLRNKGSLTEGVLLDSGSYLSVSMPLWTKPPLPPFLDIKKTDHQVLGTALLLQKQFPKASVELITKNVNLRIKSDVFGIQSKDYELNRTLEAEEMYSGIYRQKVKKLPHRAVLGRGFSLHRKGKAFCKSIYNFIRWNPTGTGPLQQGRK